MAVSALVGLVEGVGAALVPLLLSAGITGTLGALPMAWGKGEKHLSSKEGYCIVVGAWLASCVVGMLPYILWGGEFNLEKAWFESVSGFTTTGATVLRNVEALPAGLLFWRSCTHWIGGAGVVMFAMLIVPALGRSKMMVSIAEVSTLARDDYKYRSAKIIRILGTVYGGLSVACAVALKLTGMGWFDAVNHAMSIVATGGFSTHGTSIAHWNSPAVEFVTMVFMATAGLHFGVIYATLTGRRNNVFRSAVARYYVATMVGATVVIGAAVWLNGTYQSGWEALRFASFQTVSITTTSGFVAADTTLWGPMAMVVLMGLGVQCACAGSTSGGLKADRVLLAWKVFRNQIRQQQHPNAVIRIKMSGVVQESSVLGFVMLFIVAYFFLMGVGTLVLAGWGYNLTTAFSMSLVSLGNVGQGFGLAGGFADWAEFPAGVRSVCTALMLFGRLEIFGLIQLFVLKWWK